jgi:hypothetical protein
MTNSLVASALLPSTEGRRRLGRRRSFCVIEPPLREHSATTPRAFEKWWRLGGQSTSWRRAPARRLARSSFTAGSTQIMLKLARTSDPSTLSRHDPTNLLDMRMEDQRASSRDHFDPTHIASEREVGVLARELDAGGNGGGPWVRNRPKWYDQHHWSDHRKRMNHFIGTTQDKPM